MAYDLNSIVRGDALRPPRTIFLGTEKIGKTTFASRWPGAALIPMKGEEGADDPDIQRSCTVFPVCSTYSDLIGWLNAIWVQDNQFETVVIDSSSALEPLLQTHVCQTVGDKNGHPTDSIEKVLGGYGKGLTASVDAWRGLTEWLDLLRTQKNMASIIIGHVKTKRFDDPLGEAYDQYQWDIDPRAASMLFRWADLILFANSKSIVNKEDVGFNKEHKTGIDLTGGARYLFTQRRPGHPGGGRGIYGRLPYELPLDYSAFSAAVSAANAAQ